MKELSGSTSDQSHLRIKSVGVEGVKFSPALEEAFKDLTGGWLKFLAKSIAGHASTEGTAWARPCTVHARANCDRFLRRQFCYCTHQSLTGARSQDRSAVC
ncbi:unnamed protein product [Mycena citricolor]|uniref:Uncharacterized protein n=1 Tax=Mycena citricolor TaxID=2018698 RepID=A0AAD2H5B6_9AGAR|nr:unnamed protein product [Mycena citricolor]